jgi:hypothetical protein
MKRDDNRDSDASAKSKSLDNRCRWNDSTKETELVLQMYEIDVNYR